MLLPIQYSIGRGPNVFIHHYGIIRRRRLQSTSADVGWSISHNIFSRRLGYQLHKQPLYFGWLEDLHNLADMNSDIDPFVLR